MKILVVAVCKNEAPILPFFLRHYAYADAIQVWDNQSTDGGLDILRADPKVTVYPYDTGGVLREPVHTLIKAHFYKTQRADWVMVVDVDEFMHTAYPGGMRALLEHYDASNPRIVLPRIRGYHMVADKMPANDGTNLLTDMVKEGAHDPNIDKRAVFRHELDIMFGHGCHQCGAAQQIAPQHQGNEAQILLLHYRWWGEQHAIQKAENLKLSPENVANGWSTGQAVPGFMATKYRDWWNLKQKILA